MAEARPAVPRRLIDRVPLGAGLADPGAILDRFLGWVAEQGLEPWPAQEEALLELLAGKHVVLSTPTGSGKSLVALGLHFKALCEGKRSFYTAPIKALVSEKFFALCEALGAENVGMLTGDASVNWGAPVICCTAEVLAQMALRQGERTDAPYVVMDEFHYYADRDRGQAWQVPLLELPRTTFLLMSATLGNTAAIEERLARRSGREVAHVTGLERPVPLEFEYRETALHETVEALLEEGKAPVYVVNFTQREAAEVGGALTSAKITTREQREAIREAVGGFRFDTPYGKELKRMIGHGVGLHHAGLLPKYRLLVEQLAQQGLLRVIAGTDTLGVGVNIPIRTVLFTKLSKYDGEKVRMLSVRDFLQIAGRAGRKGFDDRGTVVAQAPEHVIESRRAKAKAEAKGGAKARRKQPSRKAPPGFVPWSEKTFRELATRPPEPLEPRLRVTHGMLVQILQRERSLTGRRGGYGALAALIERSHVDAARKRRLRREAAALFRSLRSAGIVRVVDHRVEVDAGLQRDFSMHEALSLYLVEALAALEPEEPTYALDLLSLVEAVLENPVPVLRAQVRKARQELLAKLKAEGVPFEERGARLDAVTWPKPLEDFLAATFPLFVEKHPWCARESLRPKSVAREMVEGFEGFDAMVRRYGLQRSEGTLLRYLGQVLHTLQRNVPDAAKTDEVHDVVAYLRQLVARVDSSLLQEWESLMHPEAAPARDETAPRPLDLALTPRAFEARVRAEMRELVRLLAQGAWEEASLALRADPEDPWDAARLGAALAPFLEAHGAVRFDAEARRSHRTRILPVAPRVWHVAQDLLDAEGDAAASLEGEVDLRGETDPQGPLVALRELRGAGPGA
jgi:superfamily II DNA/RNA helicase